MRGGDSRPGDASSATPDDSVTLRVEAACPGLLVLPDTYFPGWRATVNGEDERIYATDGAFRGVTVPEGNVACRVPLRAAAFSIGIVLAVAGLAAFVARRAACDGGGGRRARFRRPSVDRDAGDLSAASVDPTTSVGSPRVDAAPDVRGTGAGRSGYRRSPRTSSAFATRSWPAGSSTCRGAAASSSASTTATRYRAARAAVAHAGDRCRPRRALGYEDLEHQEYYAVELRQELAESLASDSRA